MAATTRQRRMPRSAPCRTAWTSPTCSTATRRRSTASTSPACARVLADDLWAQYGNADPVERRRRASPSWIGEAIADVVWQHHLLSVYHVEVDGDRAERARLPHVAPGVRGRPGHARSCSSAATTTSCGARPTAGGSAGSCSRSCGARSKADAAGYLALIGGRGPQALSRDERRCAPPEPFDLAGLRAAQPARGHGPRARARRGRAAAARATPSTGAAGRPAARRC